MAGHDDDGLQVKNSSLNTAAQSTAAQSVSPDLSHISFFYLPAPQ
jgi:hypothetical protein